MTFMNSQNALALPSPSEGQRRGRADNLALVTSPLLIAGPDHVLRTNVLDDHFQVLK